MFKFKSYNVKKVSEKNEKEQAKSSSSTGTLKKSPSSSLGTKSHLLHPQAPKKNPHQRHLQEKKKSKVQRTSNHQIIQEKSIQKRL